MIKLYPNNRIKTMQYIYLHGFASSPDSFKAKFFAKKMLEHGIELLIPDLNLNDFPNLTISRQILTVKDLIKTNSPVTLFGSSMGAIISLILAEEINNIEKLILLAPAIKISQLWKDSTGEEKLIKWKQDNYVDIFHYGYNKNMHLNYKFYEDLLSHNDSIFNKTIPTLVFHGLHDKVVPVDFAREYAKQKSHIKYYELNDDHSLNNNLDYIWQKILQFIII